MNYCPKWCWVKHIGTEHVQCVSPTKTGKPCPHHADRLNGKQPTCHVHDVDGKFQANLKGVA